MPPDDDLASHFEDVLDKEEGITPERPSKREREDGDKPENLFPDRGVDPDEEEGDGEAVDVEAEEADDQPEPDEPETEEEEQPETALDLDQVVRVNVDGQPAEVSLQEALNGYVRAETFHRRLNQLQEVAKNIEQE